MAEKGTVFVTGATGFIGTKLVELLVSDGHRVRALSRRERPDPPPGHDPNRPAPLEHEQVELVRGDITDSEALLRGIEGCRQVYHLAAYAKNWARDPQTYWRLNVQGMLNVFQAAREHGVERVVWTSSIVTFGPTPPGTVGDETMARITDRYYTDYEASKFAAEQAAVRWAGEGFPVVIVNPTRVYGPGHRTEGNAVARLIDDYDRGRVPVLINRGVNVGNYVFVDDVARGHRLAMQRGRIGERYILGGENASLKEFFRMVDRVSGKRHLQVPILSLAPLLFAGCQKLLAQWFGVYPTITPGWVRTFLVDWAYQSEKARRELGYEPMSLEQGLRITYGWLRGLREAAR